jgi:hypothetical protein
MAPAGAGPASPLAVNRSMTAGLGLPSPAQSPRVTASNGGLPHNAHMHSAMAMHQAGMRLGSSVPGSPGTSNPGIGVSSSSSSSSSLRPTAALPPPGPSPQARLPHCSKPASTPAHSRSLRRPLAQAPKPEPAAPLVQNEVRDLQARVAKLDAFFQAQIDLIPEWQKALGLIQNYKRMLDDHEARLGHAGGPWGGGGGRGA